MGDTPRLVTANPRSHAPGARQWLHARGIGGRTALAMVGLLLIGYLVRSAGPSRVAEVLWHARSWLPAIIALELLQGGSDVATLRMLMGPLRAKVPGSAWLRSTALSYAMMILVPAGRAAGEVARASLLSRYVGAARAATASAQLQASYVFAIAVLSGAECCVVATWLGRRAPLAILLAANALLMMSISAGLLAILWNARAGRWLDAVRRRISRLPEHKPAPGSGRGRSIPWRAAVICSISRTAQAAQYGVILRAVGGASSLRATLVVHGIHLVGTTLGDVLPNGLGVVDGTYRAFAREVGFADSPARALSIAFLAHVAQLVVASASILVLALSRQAAAHGATSPASAGANAPL
jgi:hypothetical protein